MTTSPFWGWDHATRGAALGGAAFGEGSQGTGKSTQSRKEQAIGDEIKSFISGEW